MDAGDMFEREQTAVRSPRYGLFGAYLAVLAPATIALYVRFENPAVVQIFDGCVGLGAAQLLTRQRQQRTRVRADKDGLWLDGKLALVRRAIRHGFVIRDEAGTWVRIGARGRLDVRVDSDEEAQALLSALRIDSASAAVRFAFGQSNWALILGFILWVGTLGTLGMPLWLAAVTILLMLSLLAYTLSLLTTVTVGSDGIHIRDHLWRRRFVSHAEIESVQATATAVGLVFTNGTTKRLPMSRNIDGDEAARLAGAFEERINQARGAYAADEESFAIHLLSRSERSAHAWFEALERLAAGASSNYRSLPRSQLREIAESPRRSAEQRLAAAVALRSSGLTDQDLPRLRAVADTCADMDLKSRLRIVMGGDDEQVVEVLERAERQQLQAELCA